MEQEVFDELKNGMCGALMLRETPEEIIDFLAAQLEWWKHNHAIGKSDS